MEINDQGVVNPLRPPLAVRTFVERLVALPVVAKVFLGLAIGDLALAFVSHGLEVATLTGALTLLLPVAIAWQTADLSKVNRPMLLGAVAVASAEVASTLLRSLDPFFFPTEISEAAINASVFPLGIRALVLTAATAIGWACIAQGAAKRRPVAGPGTRAIAVVLAALAIATGAGSVALDLLAGASQREGASSPLAAAQLLAELGYAATWTVAAVVVWVCVTRAGSAPRLATWCAGLGAAIWAIGTIPTLAISGLVLATKTDAAMGALGAGIWVYALAALATAVLFVVAFGAGLADERDPRSA